MNDPKILPCGCCEPSTAPTPVKIENRPGLSAIRYRVGTFSSFRQAMLESISNKVELTGWTSRNDDDYGVVLITMWAYLSDILTFYQERIANEAFLQTALLRASVLRLAGLLDYLPSPGVAATTHLAFTLDEGKQVNIPIGLLAQSVPGQNEAPQKFETVESIDADFRINQIRVFPVPELCNPLRVGSKKGLLSPLYAEGTIGEIVPGDKLVFFSRDRIPYVEEKEVVEIEVVDDREIIHWSPAVQTDDWTLENTQVFKWTRKYRLFGFNAPQSYMKPEPVGDESVAVAWSSVKQGDGVTGYDLRVDTNTPMPLDGLYNDLTTGTSILILDNNISQLTKIQNVSQTTARFGPMQSSVTAIAVDNEIGDTVNRREATLYELAGPETIFRNRDYPESISGNTVYIPEDQLEDMGVDRTLILDDKEQDPQVVTVAGVDKDINKKVLDAERIVRLLDEKRDLFEGYQNAEPEEEYVLCVNLHTPNALFLAQLSQIKVLVHQGDRTVVRGLVCFSGDFQPDIARSCTPSDDGLLYTIELQTDTQMPDGGMIHAEVIAGLVFENRNLITSYYDCQVINDSTFMVELDSPTPSFLKELSQIAILVMSEGRMMYRGLLVPTMEPDLVQEWNIADDELSYIFTLQPDVQVLNRGREHQIISFVPELGRPLDTESAVMLGNVAKATHGETVAEDVLGNGDASTSFQVFPLKKSPVTYVPKAGAPNGAENTLKLYVGGVLWHVERNLYGHESDERIFTTRMDDANTMTVQFGDGKTGARLPSGRNNIVASYRQGIGMSGNVAANTLTTLLDRPIGLKSTLNPTAAIGGANRETRDEARINAPNTVRTFGRIVSLRDFEDAAREFAGVAKARAFWVWDGEERVVQLTVAGSGGAEITGTSYDNLVADLNSRRDRNRKLDVGTFRRVPIDIDTAIEVKTDYIINDIQASTEQALKTYFAFDNMDLGQPIHLSDIYQVLQNVEGVEAVDLNRLQFAVEADRLSHGASMNHVQDHLRIFHFELPELSVSPGLRVKTGMDKS